MNNQCYSYNYTGKRCQRICNTRYCWQHGGRTINKKEYYTSKSKIQDILEKYKEKRGKKDKILVICHGAKYKKYKNMPNYKILFN